MDKLTYGNSEFVKCKFDVFAGPMNSVSIFYSEQNPYIHLVPIEGGQRLWCYKTFFTVKAFSALSNIFGQDLELHLDKGTAVCYTWVLSGLVLKY